MIVKNEARVIRRCLDSVRAILDHWIIVDTGSTDGTQDVIRAAMVGLPGEVVERPWVDFGTNRTEALALARGHGDYSFIIDADDELDLAPGYALPDLHDDSYVIDILYGVTNYQRPQLVKNTLQWAYRGVLHEFLECADAKTKGYLPILMRINHEGDRSTDTETYNRDAAILERALTTETDPLLVSRYTFYLAQSYRDCGRIDESIERYLARVDLGFWQEEIFFSLLQAGRLMESQRRDVDTVLAVYRRASEACPFRAEADHSAARLCRHHERFAEGYRLAKRAIDLVVPRDGLFVERWIYEYGLLDEYAVNAYWSGHYKACADAVARALASGKVPDADRPRFEENARFANEKLPHEMVTVVPTTINLGSGKDFRADCLNIDVDASWHPDVVVDLSAIKLGPDGYEAQTKRLGELTLKPAMFDTIIANDVLEHVPDLVALMTTCLTLLRPGGVFKISVPYDLSFGAWQDPTHVRSFNERSWLYYSDWFWYLGWTTSRFVVDGMDHVPSPLGVSLRGKGVPDEEIHRTPRAIDSMSVTLRKIDLTPADLETSNAWRDKKRVAEIANWQTRTGVEPSAIGPAFGGTWNDNRERFCIWIVQRAGYVHSHAFDDAAEALSAAFGALGGSAPIIEGPEAIGTRLPIIFGCHLLTDAEQRAIPAGSVLMNLEQANAPGGWMSRPYVDLLKRYPVLDYSIRNTEALKALGIGHARHFPIRAMPGIERPAAPQDIDVLFYGSMSDRRGRVLDDLRGRGLNVVSLFGAYGAERDAAMARAKVVVNIHFWDDAIFEAVRVCHCLAAGTCVVSEGSAEDPDSADIATGLVLCGFDEIADRCADLVRDETKRRALARSARAAIETNAQTRALRAAFS